MAYSNDHHLTTPQTLVAGAFPEHKIDELEMMLNQFASAIGQLKTAPPYMRFMREIYDDLLQMQHNESMSISDLLHGVQTLHSVLRDPLHQNNISNLKIFAEKISLIDEQSPLNTRLKLLGAGVAVAGLIACAVFIPPAAPICAAVSQAFAAPVIPAVGGIIPQLTAATLLSDIVSGIGQAIVINHAMKWYQERNYQKAVTSLENTLVSMQAKGEHPEAIQAAQSMISTVDGLKRSKDKSTNIQELTELLNIINGALNGNQKSIESLEAFEHDTLVAKTSLLARFAYYGPAMIMLSAPLIALAPGGLAALSTAWTEVGAQSITGASSATSFAVNGLISEAGSKILDTTENFSADEAAQHNKKNIPTARAAMLAFKSVYQDMIASMKTKESETMAIATDASPSTLAPKQ